jgi:anti-sigma28 factor (negative regulator of flagellin synthesis)
LLFWWRVSKQKREREQINMASAATFAFSATAAAGVRRGAKVTSSSSVRGATLTFAHPSPSPSTRRSAVHSSKSTRLAASKFQKISVSSEDAEGSATDPAAAAAAAADESTKPKLEILGLANENGTLKFDDDELPDNLFDAVATAATATDEAIQNGSLGNLVELRIPELWDPISVGLYSRESSTSYSKYFKHLLTQP